MNFFQRKKDYFSFYPGPRKPTVHNLSDWWALLCIIVVLALGYFSRARLLQLPNALTTKDAADHSESFIGQRAWDDLYIITGFGPRVSGTKANEILAVEFLKQSIDDIQRNAHANQKIYADIQQTSGSYFINFKPHPMTNVYRNVQNVIVKLLGQDEFAETSLLLNCHFDSVAGSPGASDDAASCAVMLETLRVLSKQKQRLNHSVIFLFNGAEEVPLQAAHGFITQHKWAKSVKAFLNLESVGSNGKEILFQSGPKHGWLIDLYKAAIPYPNGQVAAEEIFQLGLIPSDTDFRIFRDFGNVPGMDFAHNMYGYRYHTKYDHIDYLPPNVLQRTGDNILSLVKIIANSDQLANTKAYENDRMVYFDFLGYIFIAYSESTAQVLNVIVSLASIIIPYFLIQAKGTKSKHIRREIGAGFLLTILAFVFGNAICFLIYTEIDWNGHAMSWYTQTYLAILLYGFPSVAIHCLFYSRSERDRESSFSLGLKTQANLIGVNLFWASLNFILTLLGYRLAYLFMLPNLIYLISNVINALLRAQNTSKKWVFIHVVGQIFVVLWTTHIYHLIVAVFIPITGRSGGNSNPDATIGIILCFFSLFTTSYLVPLVGLLRNPKFIYISLFAICVLTRISFTGSHISFPYSDDIDNPTPQRHYITHTVRRIYDNKGRLQYTDAGYWFRELDRNTVKTVDSLTAPENPVRQEEIPLCRDLPFCGLPIYSCRQLHTGGFWLPASPPLIKEEPMLKIFTNKKIVTNLQQIEFTIGGSLLYSLQLRPKPGVKLVKWSLLDEVPEQNQVNSFTGYVAMINHGLSAPPMNVSLTLEIPSEHYEGTILDITLVGFYWEFEITPLFAQLLARVPKWAFAVPSVASLHSWTV